MVASCGGVSAPSRFDISEIATGLKTVDDNIGMVCYRYGIFTLITFIMLIIYSYFQLVINIF